MRNVHLRPKVFEQTYFEYKEKYNTVLTRFLFIQNMFSQRLLISTVHFITYLNQIF